MKISSHIYWYFVIYCISKKNAGLFFERLRFEKIFVESLEERKLLQEMKNFDSEGNSVSSLLKFSQIHRNLANTGSLGKFVIKIVSQNSPEDRV